MSELTENNESANGQSSQPEEQSLAHSKTRPHLDEGSNGTCADTVTQLIKPPPEALADAAAAAAAAEAKKLLKISCHKCLQKLDVTYLEPFSRFECPSCGIELIVPRWFDNYLLEEPGGIGGMATVYRALDLALDREVAIKVLNQDVSSQAESGELFLHEARTAATINHYAVIPIYTCGLFDGQPYIVMQYMGGGSLETKLKLARGTLPIADVAKWIASVAEGLDNARRHGIIHHDVKPGNIMLDVDGNAKIGDFGLAQAIDDVRSKQLVEMTKAWVSPNYVSPEKVRDGKEDFLGDVYSLGATFYHLATGFTPFSSPSVDELIKMRLTGDPLPPHRQRPDLPLPLSHLILSMMDRESDKRPHYREIAKTINEYLKSSDPAKGKTILKGTKLKAPSSGNVVLHAPAQPKADAPVEESKKTSRSSTMTIISLLMSVILAGVVVIGWKTGRLQKAFPCFKSAAQAPQEECDRVPAATAAFAKGDIPAAIAAAEKEFTNVSAPSETRMQAAVQLAIGKYLAKDSAAKDNCAFIAERLEAIRTASMPSGGELSLGDPPGKEIVSFLANYDSKPSDLTDRLASASPSMRIAGSLAVFLRSTKTRMPKEMVLSIFNDYRKASLAAPQSIWGNVWQPRLELWSDVLDGAPANSAIEPMIAALPQQLGIKPSERPAPKTAPSQDAAAPVSTAPAAAATAAPQAKKTSEAEPVLLEKFSELGLTAFLSRLALLRPHPAGLKFEQQSLDRYLTTVSNAERPSESARAAVVASLRSYFERSLLRIPMEFDSFESPSGELGKGTLFTNGKGLIYKNVSGRVPVKWEDLTSKHYALLADAYAKLLESVAFDDPKDSPLRHESASEILRLAVLAGWFGDYKVASRSAQRALRIDQSLGAEAERLLLK